MLHRSHRAFVAGFVVASHILYVSYTQTHSWHKPEEIAGQRGRRLAGAGALSLNTKNNKWTVIFPFWFLSVAATPDLSDRPVCVFVCVQIDCKRDRKPGCCCCIVREVVPLFIIRFLCGPTHSVYFTAAREMGAKHIDRCSPPVQDSNNATGGLFFFCVCDGLLLSSVFMPSSSNPNPSACHHLLIIFWMRAGDFRQHRANKKKQQRSVFFLFLFFSGQTSRGDTHTLLVPRKNFRVWRSQFLGRHKTKHGLRRVVLPLHTND